MSGFLLDTNVISELRRGERCDRAVAEWFADQDDDTLFLSVLTIGQVRRGVLLIQQRDPAQAQRLGRWLNSITEQWSGRILPVDEKSAMLWAELMSPAPRPVVDALLGATALRHNLTLVTRNTADLDGSGVHLLNPFSE